MVRHCTILTDTHGLEHYVLRFLKNVPWGKASA
jgi:hypothetical protein